MDIVPVLDRLASRLEEARAAAAVIAEGDASAMAELDAEVEGMASDVAELKAMTSGPPSG